jgi:hypothetical protein
MKLRFFEILHFSRRISPEPEHPDQALRKNVRHIVNFTIEVHYIQKKETYLFLN